MQAGRGDLLKQRAISLSCIIAFFLALSKFAVGIAMQSVAIMASALDSIFDFFTSVINLFAVKTAARPADDDHRFGHGKAEGLASFLQAIIILLSGCFLLFLSVKKLLERTPVEILPAGFWVMAVSMVGTIIIVSYQNYVLKKARSLVVQSDRLHYVSDLLTNLAVIGSLLFEKFFDLAYIDAICGIGISFYIGFSSFKILVVSINTLMDKDHSHLYRASIEKIINADKNILGYHDVRSRSVGETTFLYFHLEMPKDLSLEKSHSIADNVITELKKQHSELDIMIHADPVYIDEKGEVRLLDKNEPRFY